MKPATKNIKNTCLVFKCLDRALHRLFLSDTILKTANKQIHLCHRHLLQLVFIRCDNKAMIPTQRQLKHKIKILT